MDPFSISCTTCQVSLKVRDPSAIGQILTCPKCGSMVLVEPPAEMASQAAADSTSTATARGESPPTRAAPVPPPRPTPPSDDATTASDGMDLLPADEISAGPVADQGRWREDFSSAVDEIDEPPLDEAGSGRSAAEALAELPPAAILPTDDWVSARMRRWRNALLMTSAAVAGVLSAILLFGFVAARWNTPPVDDTVSLNETPLSNEPTDPPNVASPSESNGENNRESNGGDLPSAEPPDSVENSIPESPNTGAPDVEPDASVSESADPQTKDPEANQLDEDPPPDGPVAPPESPESSTSDAPPDLVADPPSLSSAETTEADRLGGNSELSQLLRQFQDLLGEESGSYPEAVVEESDAVTAEPTPDDETPEGPDTIARPVPRTVDVEARLEDEISAIKFEGTPLSAFLQFMNEFSTIPLTIHAESLLWLQLPPDAPITISLEDVTVAQILDEALTPLGLSWRVDEDRILVHRKETNPSGMRRVTFDVADLAGDREGMQQLSRWILDLVQPSSWVDRGGRGRLEIEGSTVVARQREAVLFEILFLFEQLRIARELPLKTRFRQELFQPLPPQRRAETALNRPITMTFIKPTLLQEVLRQMQAQAKLPLVTDWGALASEGWTPDTEVTFSCIEQPLHTALKQLLDSLELTYRVVHPDLLEVTTTEQATSHDWISYYPDNVWVQSDNRADGVLRVRATLGSDAAAYMDPVSGALFVRGNAEAHRKVSQDSDGGILPP